MSANLDVPHNVPTTPHRKHVLHERTEGDVLIECACGMVIEGASEQALLDAARRHIAAEHHELGGPLADEDLLAMAFDEPAANSIPIRLSASTDP